MKAVVRKKLKKVFLLYIVSVYVFLILYVVKTLLKSFCEI